MPDGQMPFPGYFDQDALKFAVDIVKKTLDAVSWFNGHFGSYFGG
ncbi:MAG: hypothetical protein E7A62_07145 [Actinomycetaceae bacterium]|nr:hypothetical protein [Actinomycetaceae bacterium]MDU0970754.1 hypothetical protein [Actinomycetaceae bacterium]